MPVMPMTHTEAGRRTPVHILGAGPGGLAVAAALGERGIASVVLERSDTVGSSWRRHYDRLHLHTTRAQSSLPGLPIPRAFGRWVARDDMVRYLETYAAHHGIEVATGVDVDRIERRDGRWVLHANGGRRPTATTVVVATGFNHTPHLPDWPGRADFTGQLLHAGDYRSAAPFRGKDVLVVGAGNTGAEIAADLAESGAHGCVSPCAPRRTSCAAPLSGGPHSAARSCAAGCRCGWWTRWRPGWRSCRSPIWRPTGCPGRTPACTPGCWRARSPCRTWG
ncbi:hypothetical protein SCA03_20850 [Streptomyces cacaoi]|uniref:Monooxygenase n=1 Tax=Streptomyces cacaoi TaxID=1898 RepID=A0A4Y3QVW2_STRCI|nr:hypothetical protein SCA03_20850 [Streptomyces cacaoi]